MGVWIETDVIWTRYSEDASLPMWECGLKQKVNGSIREAYGVTPHVGVWIETYNFYPLGNLAQVTPHVGVWIETLTVIDDDNNCASLPMWECGLKQRTAEATARAEEVTPHVGVWIETSCTSASAAIIMSLPMWECGLKQGQEERQQRAVCVTPHVGVWIETWRSALSR